MKMQPPFLFLAGYRASMMRLYYTLNKNGNGMLVMFALRFLAIFEVVWLPLVTGTYALSITLIYFCFWKSAYW